MVSLVCSETTGGAHKEPKKGWPTSQRQLRKLKWRKPGDKWPVSRLIWPQKTSPQCASCGGDHAAHKNGGKRGRRPVGMRVRDDGRLKLYILATRSGGFLTHRWAVGVGTGIKLCSRRWRFRGTQRQRHRRGADP